MRRLWFSMVKVAIVRRELPIWSNILLRISIAIGGIALAVSSLAFLLRIPVDLVASRVIDVFIRLDALRYMTVFLPTALGLAIAFHAKLWNLGAEGQIVLGAIGATYIALFTPVGEVPFLGATVSLVFASIAGALWALVPALLRTFLGVNEALTTLMMNYIAYYLANYLVYGPWRGRTVYGYPETDPIPTQCRFPWFPGYSFSIYPLIISFALVPLVYMFLYKTRIGIAIRALGSSGTAVELSGISRRKVAIIAFVLSGALAGFVGGNEVLMYHRKLVPGEKIGAGMGFISILVVWFADLNPLVVPLASYYVSSLHYLRMVIQVGELTEAVARFFVGLIFVLMLLSIFVARYRVVVKR
ncbi:MAG: ABC transporter permease [Ignisphaera sp.]